MKAFDDILRALGLDDRSVVLAPNPEDPEEETDVLSSRAVDLKKL